MGSLAFTAAARAVWFIMENPDNPAERYMLNAGMNLAADPGGLVYELTTNHGHPDWPDVATVGWKGKVDMDADKAQAAQAAAKRQPTAIDECVDWIRDILAGGPIDADEFQAAASAAGHSTPTLKRARAKLGVKAEGATDDKGRRTKWTVRLP
jgi:hypothetical protein